MLGLVREMNSNDVWSILSSLGSIGAAVFAGWQIYLSRKTSSEEFNWRKIERVASHSMYKDEQYLNSIERIKSECPDAFKEDKSVFSVLGEKHQSDARIIINHWGRLASEIKLKLVDEDAAYQFHGRSLCNTYMAFKEYVESQNEKVPPNYPDLAEVAERWLKRRNHRS